MPGIAAHLLWNPWDCTCLAMKTIQVLPAVCHTRSGRQEYGRFRVQEGSGGVQRVHSCGIQSRPPPALLRLLLRATACC